MYVRLKEAFTPGIRVEKHVHRITNRLGLVKTLDTVSTKRRVEKFIPHQYWDEVVTELIGFG
jgi:endonuclease-3